MDKTKLKNLLSEAGLWHQRQERSLSLMTVPTPPEKWQNTKASQLFLYLDPKTDELFYMIPSIDYQGVVVSKRVNIVSADFYDQLDKGQVKNLKELFQEQVTSVQPLKEAKLGDEQSLACQALFNLLAKREDLNYESWSHEFEARTDKTYALERGLDSLEKNDLLRYTDSDIKAKDRVNARLKVLCDRNQNTHWLADALNDLKSNGLLDNSDRGQRLENILLEHPEHASEIARALNNLSKAGLLPDNSIGLAREELLRQHPHLADDLANALSSLKREGLLFEAEEKADDAEHPASVKENDFVQAVIEADARARQKDPSQQESAKNSAVWMVNNLIELNRILLLTPERQKAVLAKAELSFSLYLGLEHLKNAQLPLAPNEYTTWVDYLIKHAHASEAIAEGLTLLRTHKYLPQNQLGDIRQALLVNNSENARGNVHALKVLFKTDCLNLSVEVPMALEEKEANKVIQQDNFKRSLVDRMLSLKDHSLKLAAGMDNLMATQVLNSGTPEEKIAYALPLIEHPAQAPHLADILSALLNAKMINNSQGYTFKAMLAPLTPYLEHASKIWAMLANMKNCLVFDNEEKYKIYAMIFQFCDRYPQSAKDIFTSLSNEDLDQRRFGYSPRFSDVQQLLLKKLGEFRKIEEAPTEKAYRTLHQGLRTPNTSVSTLPPDIVTSISTLFTPAKKIKDREIQLTRKRAEVKEEKAEDKESSDPSVKRNKPTL